MGYAKLFSSITESSLWSEPKDVRILFVSMLARADATGFVEAAIPGLARISNLSLLEVESSLKVLESPDPHSKDLLENPENQGRRIIRVPGGWSIINYEAYRDRPNEEARREWMREYMRKYRNNLRNCKQPVNPCKPPLAQAEAEAEAEAHSSIPIAPSSVPSPQSDMVSEIYNAYPRKAGKPSAIRAIKKQLQQYSAEFLLEKTKLYAAARIGSDPKYTPHPATWFNDERFNDDPSEWKISGSQRSSPKGFDRAKGTLNEKHLGDWDLKKIQAKREVQQQQLPGT